ncbi:hypothetical protein KAR91_29820 [Candidatus Pacearchaeota archaeon]|nr:hypothetical protein [Candidatus Pacearchaeota archaeon]
MADFNFDEDSILDTIAATLADAGYNASERQMAEIVNAINEGFPGVVEVLTYGMQEHWKDEALGSGTGWGQKYANAIKAEVTGNKGHIYVDEKMTDKTSDKPNMMYVKMVEKGMNSFSIKDALLASDKAKIGPSGIRYIIVPFPVATPRKGSKTKMAKKFGGREMTAEMHKIAKSGGRVKSGKLKTGEDVSGLTRYVTRQRHSQYGIFRMVTENSKGWIHPGKKPSPVFPSVVQEVNKRVGEVVHEFIRAIVKEYTT